MQIVSLLCLGLQMKCQTSWRSSGPDDVMWLPVQDKYISYNKILQQTAKMKKSHHYKQLTNPNSRKGNILSEQQCEDG